MAAWAKYLAHQLAEARGWGRGIRFAVNRGLALVLTGYVEDDVIRHTEIFAPLRALDLRVGHVVTVLEEMGIFEDDSEPSFEGWIAARLEGLAPGIRSEAERWTRVLRDGGPRSLPRREGTVWLYLNRVRPALLEWSNRYDRLREVTRDDVLTYVKTLHGRQRHDQLVALRSLFTWAKRNGLIFRNPTSRIKVGQYEYAVLQPLVPAQVDRSVTVATTPATRLILTLAAVHAARVAQIGTLMLDDIDLGNRRLTIAGRVRPLDDLTMKLLLDRLGAPAKPVAEHREPPPAGQQPDRHQDQPRQQPLDQCLDARAGRDTGAAPRRPATRRGSDARARSSSPRRGVRARREDRDALRGLRTGTAGAGC
ncbi:hypothetical protein [Streptomyces violaceusniger]|uniref:hypothetical protein n=1 Tax=Streptomyces violaceusniger TaxID=68280 RepID=UPI0009C2EB42|nr:hypothetical protein [Streptomyces hygroscopicus]AQW46574.1 hypothetical protein SHXM_00037 [Streptomyces hygroscopicus]